MSEDDNKKAMNNSDVALPDPAPASSAAPLTTLASDSTFKRTRKNWERATHSEDNIETFDTVVKHYRCSRNEERDGKPKRRNWSQAMEDIDSEFCNIKCRIPQVDTETPTCSDCIECCKQEVIACDISKLFEATDGTKTCGMVPQTSLSTKVETQTADQVDGKSRPRKAYAKAPKVVETHSVDSLKHILREANRNTLKDKCVLTKKQQKLITAEYCSLPPRQTALIVEDRPLGALRTTINLDDSLAGESHDSQDFMDSHESVSQESVLLGGGSVKSLGAKVSHGHSISTQPSTSKKMAANDASKQLSAQTSTTGNKAGKQNSTYPSYKQRQLELHKIRMTVEQKRSELLDMKIAREREEMRRETLLFEKEIALKDSKMRSINGDKV